jgi:hypothetical protein
VWKTASRPQHAAAGVTRLPQPGASKDLFIFTMLNNFETQQLYPNDHAQNLG